MSIVHLAKVDDHFTLTVDSTIYGIVEYSKEPGFEFEMWCWFPEIHVWARDWNELEAFISVVSTQVE